MARLLFPTNSNYPYHITARTHNREKFLLPMSEMWTMVADQLGFTRSAYDLQIHAFLLMPNHFHLLASANNQNLSQAMGRFLCETTKEVNRRANTENQLWGRRFYRSEIRSPHYFNLAYKYLYRNPVTANIVGQCEDYTYSSLHLNFGQTDVFLAIKDDLLVEDPVGTMQWLNHKPDEVHWASVKKALRRKVFTLPKINRRPNPLENDSL